MTVGIYILVIGLYHYIGQSVNVENRIRGHFRSLSDKSHKNEFMQRVYNKYGPGHGWLLEECACKDLNSLERQYIQLNKSALNLMNLTDGGEGTLGWVQPQHVRDAVGKANAERQHSPETRERLSNSLRGRDLHWGDKIGGALKGKPKSEQHRANISKARAGKKLSAEHRAAIGAGCKGKTPWNKGKTESAEHRAAISAGMLKHWEEKRGPYDSN